MVGTVKEVTVLLSATADGTERDLWRLVRRESEFRTMRHDHSGLSRVYRDGQRPYLKGEHGLHGWVHEALLEARSRLGGFGRGKHFSQGWPRDWSEIEDVQPTTGTGFIYPEELEQFPRSKSGDAVRLALGADTPQPFGFDDVQGDALSHR